MKKGIKYFFDSWLPLAIFVPVTLLAFYALWDSNKQDMSTVDQVISVLDVASANGFVVLAFVSMVVLASRKFRRKRSHQKSLQPNMERKHGGLVIIIGSRGNADENRKKLNTKFNIEDELIEVVVIGKGQGNIKKTIMPEIKEKILEAYNVLVENSVEDIYLMIAGPMPIAFLAGDILSNKLPVYFVQHPDLDVWHLTENNHEKQEEEVIEGYEHS